MGSTSSVNPLAPYLVCALCGRKTYLLLDGRCGDCFQPTFGATRTGYIEKPAAQRGACLA